ncbi:uncharacterized protein LOC118185476 [Stegodyphus dumicola]|uniref:uncharacterized protein LOC118185476 n=1 Tax=Stegodyphus dumicola TaxID=202533 RepID=UPI0015A8505D|nr:uncharacterized protein LOC118185476 [Stegodyphus dumicola]
MVKHNRVQLLRHDANLEMIVTGMLLWKNLMPFFALLYARGALGHSKLCANDLWNKNWGPPAFKETMSRNRFREIMRYLRFDVRSTRADRLATNKFAPASETWYKLMENCYLCYNPGPEITVDEQLLPCKSRCRSIQYMANKLDKFGVWHQILASN